MGKSKKAHNKKIANRNKRLKDTAKFIQRLRAKKIQELIKQQDAEKTKKA